jgi:hypothetical protein
MNSVVARLVKKVRNNGDTRGNKEDDSDDKNLIVTKAKKGPSLSEINYQTEEIDMIDPLYLQNLPSVFDDVHGNLKPHL